MSEFECPHCGEPIDRDASVCPYCGSDGETGWSSDVEYYSVELPDDDFEWSHDEPGTPGPSWSAGPNDPDDSRGSLLLGGGLGVTRGGTGGIVLLTAALVTFLIAGYHAWGWAAFLAAVVLLVSFGSARALRRR